MDTQDRLRRIRYSASGQVKRVEGAKQTPKGSLSLQLAVSNSRGAGTQNAVRARGQGASNECWL